MKRRNAGVEIGGELWPAVDWGVEIGRVGGEAMGKKAGAFRERSVGDEEEEGYYRIETLKRGGVFGNEIVGMMSPRREMS